MSTDPSLVPGRSCAGCTLCCKVLGIAELRKPQGQWCTHCDAGKGCRIYDQRPRECRTFHCGYLTREDLPAHWSPLQSRMVVVPELGGIRVAVHVDPARPDAWSRRPYYSDLRRWAAKAVPHKGQVVVYAAARAIVILPDKHVDLGALAADEVIVTQQRRAGLATTFDAWKAKRDDPRAPGAV